MSIVCPELNNAIKNKASVQDWHTNFREVMQLVIPKREASPF
jgi:hypothetical protein